MLDLRCSSIFGLHGNNTDVNDHENDDGVADGLIWDALHKAIDTAIRACTVGTNSFAYSILPKRSHFTVLDDSAMDFFNGHDVGSSSQAVDEVLENLRNCSEVAMIANAASWLAWSH